jgi:hypothetical protein
MKLNTIQKETFDPNLDPKKPVPAVVFEVTQAEADWLKSYPANYQNLVEGIKNGKARITDPVPIPQYERCG